MKYRKLISMGLSFVGTSMILMAFIIGNVGNLNNKTVSKVVAYDEVDIKNLATAKRNAIEEVTPSPAEKVEEVVMEPAPISTPVLTAPPRQEVLDGLTLEELAEKLNRSLGSNLSGKGYLIASHCLEVGVDPYVATAIMLHETGCKWNCSTLVQQCNNVGGQKGSPGCNGGSYKYYDTLDAGIVGMIDNLARNYYSRGLTTVEAIGPRYAESDTWVSKINSYVYSIRSM